MLLLIKMDNLPKAFNFPNNSIKSALSAFFFLLIIFFIISLSVEKKEDRVYKITPVFEKIDKKEEKQEIKKIEIENALLYINESPKNLEKLEMDTSSLLPNFVDNFTEGGLNASFGEALMDFEEAKLEIFEVAQLDKTPRIIKRGRIEYPPNMLQKGIEGEVRLIVLIDEDGNLSLDKVLSATNEYFEKAAISALKEFKYTAPEKMGKKVKARFILPIPFNIGVL